MDFLEKFREVCPFGVKHIQTDNGSDFTKHFAGYAEREKKFIYVMDPYKNLRKTSFFIFFGNSGKYLRLVVEKAEERRKI